MESAIFVLNAEQVAANPEPGVHRKILTYNENLMVCEITLENGCTTKAHTHVHDQVTYVVEGCVEFEVNGKKSLVRAGDSVYMPSNCLHSITRVLEDSKIVDVFNPMRKDFL